MAKKKGNPTRRIFVFIGVLVVVLVLVGVGAKSVGFLGNSDKGAEVEFETVSIHTITQVVTASGRVQPEIEVNISPDVSGEIIELPVAEGDPVRKGQLLASIKPDFYKAQVEQADASVLQSKASLAQRRADLKNAEFEQARQKKLFDKGAISESEYLAAQTRLEVGQASYEAAEYSVKIAEARLRESQEQLSKTTLYAPMDGTVSMLNVELGERVVGTSQMAGTEMMRVAKLNRMELEVDVNENDVVNISVGDTAAVEVDAYPERIFHGIVTEIANSARVSGAGSSEQVTNFPVKIRILDKHNTSMAMSGVEDIMSNSEIPIEGAETPNFRPGMSGTVDVFTRTIGAAIAVPIQSVTVRDFNKLKDEDEFDEDGNEIDASDEASDDDADSGSKNDEEDLRRVVFLMVDGVSKMVEVKTGISNDTHVVILSGVSEGEDVITGPYRAISRTLEDGDAVVEKEEDEKKGRFGKSDS
jgi:HlyD family secretion protein